MKILIYVEDHTPKLSSEQVLSKQKYESPQIKEAKRKHLINGHKKIMAQKMRMLDSRKS